MEVEVHNIKISLSSPPYPGSFTESDLSTIIMNDLKVQ